MLYELTDDQAALARALIMRESNDSRECNPRVSRYGLHRALSTPVVAKHFCAHCGAVNGVHTRPIPGAK